MNRPSEKALKNFYSFLLKVGVPRLTEGDWQKILSQPPAPEVTAA